MTESNRPIRCVVVTNVPTPYRVPVWEGLAESGAVELHLVYCAAAHIDPSQDGRSSRYQVHFLQGRYQAFDTRFTHADWRVTSLLSSIKPDVVVTTGFIPTFVFAAAWAVWHRVPHVAMTDGTLETERSLTWKHRSIRRLVFGFTREFVGACKGSTHLYLSYGVPIERVHVSALCTDNARFAAPKSPRDIDLLFCGRFLALKNPLFTMNVAKDVAIRLGRRVRLMFVGMGEMEAEMREHAAHVTQWVDTEFAGYLSQDALPAIYARARVFLFPTSMDCWGVVVNEACAAGVPCVTSPHTGVVGELIKEGVSGFVCPLDPGIWADRCVQLLSDGEGWQRMSDAARMEVSRYTFANAAQGLLGALQSAVTHQGRMA